MAARKNPTPQGLRLTLPGAPDTPHVVPGVAGLYRPSTPTPVGGDTDPVTIERAQELHADPGVPLELVAMTATDADRARGELVDHIDDSRSALASARREARQTGSTPEEAERITDEAAAVAAGTDTPTTEDD